MEVPLPVVVRPILGLAPLIVEYPAPCIAGPALGEGAGVAHEEHVSVLNDHPAVGPRLLYRPLPQFLPGRGLVPPHAVGRLPGLDLAAEFDGYRHRRVGAPVVEQEHDIGVAVGIQEDGAEVLVGFVPGKDCCHDLGHTSQGLGNLGTQGTVEHVGRSTGMNNQTGSARATNREHDLIGH